MTGPRFLDAGECALVVEFGTTLDENLTAKVRALDRAMTAAAIPGVEELVPTFRSLMIHYNPLQLPRATLVDAVAPLLKTGLHRDPDVRRWSLPACYDPEFAEDLAHVAASTGLAPDAVIAAHASAVYRVAMYGFAPGWAYLSGLPPGLFLPRRITPRDRIPDGSLIIAGGQAIVAGSAMPSGWHILGRTAERLFNPARDPAFALDVGDIVTFRRVDRATFQSLSNQASTGALVATRVSGPP